MQTANCVLVINEFKSKIPKNGVTPAEVQLLIQMHHGNAGQMPIENLTIGKDIDRNAVQEKNRLKQHYIVKHDDADRVTVESVFPGPTPTMPVKFEDVVDIDGNKIFNKEGKLLSAPVAKVETQIVQKIKVGDKEYTAEELAKLVPTK